MDLSEIQKYHCLEEMWVDTNQLLLDPTNPRINLDETTPLKDIDLAKENIQEEIYQRINKKEHHISDLIEGIKNSGFSSGISTFIVKEIAGTGKYLVLEGNRRTTAIKYLLKNSHLLNNNVYESIKRIKVQRFEYIQNPYFPEEAIIDIILGKIHITGALAWGAMEKAHYIHKTYLRELQKSYVFESEVYYFHDDAVLKRTTGFFDFKKADIIKSIKVYNVFSQLRSNGYKPDSDRYSLIELAVSDQAVSENYFGLDEYFDFSEEGMDRFNTLCLEGTPPIIRNPQNFKDFIMIYKGGEMGDIRSIENRSITIEELARDYNARLNSNNFAKKLQDIKRKLETLNIGEFKNSPEERKATSEIVSLIKNRLIPLFSSDSTIQTPEDETDINIHTVIGMNSCRLKNIIVETIDDCPNGTCTSDSIATRILKKLGVVTRGEPRKQFEDRVEVEIAALIAEGSIKAYKAKNTRLRVC